MTPTRDPRYLAYIRTQPCILVPKDCRGKVEAAHVGPHGMGQKSSDYSVVPLCSKHHRFARDSYHNLGPRKFEAAHHVDLTAIVKRLNAKPFIRIREGVYVVELNANLYMLGSVAAGFERAIENLKRIRRLEAAA